jgi:membrane protease YdiL (CAAX protease family)
VLSGRGDIVLRFVQALSPAAEFLIVVVGAFGLFIFRSIVDAVDPHPSGLVQFSDEGMRSLLTYELVVFCLLCAFLYVRGWTLKGVGFAPGLYATLEGLGLGLVSIFACELLYVTVVSVAPQVHQAAPHFSSSGLALSGIIAGSIVNPVFEETFVSGYVIAVLKDRYGAWNAVNVSTGIRLLYHLYQGVAGVLSIVPIGLIFAHWYARRGNLWPLVVAHAWIDLSGLILAGAG